MMQSIMTEIAGDDAMPKSLQTIAVMSGVVTLNVVDVPSNNPTTATTFVVDLSPFASFGRPVFSKSGRHI